MGVNSVGYDYVSTTNYTSTTTAAATANEKAETEAAEKTSETKSQKAETYKPDLDKIREMKANLKSNMLAFKQMVYAQFKGQGQASGVASGDSSLADMLKGIAGMTQEDAQKAISADGEWGVDATANRILDFAKALSGGDPSKIETLRDAVNKGFKAAGKAWGGDLPEISHQTLKKVMDGFDEWAKSASASTQAASQVTA